MSGYSEKSKAGRVPSPYQYILGARVERESQASEDNESKPERM